MDANDDRGAFDELVRRRIREHRKARGLTLAQVSERAHIDLSTLSRLESGKRRLALDHIPALAAALGVTTDHLVDPETRADPRVRRSPRTEGGLTIWPLNRAPKDGGTQAFKIVITDPTREPPAQLPVHEGEDWVYVLRGRLVLILGEERYELDAGDAAEFSSWTPHWFGAADGPVEYLLVVGPQGERHHLHPDD